MEIRTTIEDNLYERYKTIAKESGLKITFVTETILTNAVEQYIKENK